MTQETSERTYDDYFNEFFDDKHEDKRELNEEDKVSTQEETEVSVDQDEKLVLSEEAGEEKDTSQEEADSSASSTDNSADADYDSILDSVEDPDLKKKIQRLVQSDRSQKGRVSALTKKLNKLEEYYSNAIAASQAQPSRQPEEHKAPASTADDQSGRNESEEVSPEMAALKEKYPGVYAALEKMADAKARKGQEDLQRTIDERVRPIEESYRQEANRREAARLEQMAGELFDTEKTGITIRDVIVSEDFSSWLRGQTPQVRDFYKRASTAEEAMLVLNKFENDYQYMKSINDKLASYDSASDNKEEPDSTKGDKLKAKRDATKSKSVSPRSKSTPTTAVDTSDYDSIFDRMWGEDGIYRTKRALG